MFKFYGYNNGKAIALKNQYNMLIISLAFVILCLIITFFAFVFNVYYLLWCWFVPLFLFILSFLVLLFEKYDTQIYLKGLRHKHKFIIEDNKLFKDGREIKSIKNIKIREYRKVIFIELKQSFYVVYKDELNCNAKYLINKIKGLCNTNYKN